MRLLLAFAIVVAVGLLLWEWSGDGGHAPRRGSPPEPTRAHVAPTAPPESAKSSTTRAKAEGRVRTTRPGPILEVTVRDEFDRFRADVPVSLRQSTPNGPVVVAQGITDKNGFVRFEDPDTGRVTIHIDPGGTFEPYFAAFWNPDEGHRAMRLRLFRPREITIHVKNDGRPGIPEGMKINAPRLHAEQRDPATGTIRACFIPLAVPMDHLSVSASAPRRLPAGANVELGPPGEPVEVDLEFRPSVLLELEVFGRPGSFKGLTLARMLGPRFSFSVAGATLLELNSGDTPARTSLTVTPATYQLGLSGDGAHQPVHIFTVPAGAERHRVTLDLRDAQWIEFETVFPSSYVPPASPMIVVDPDSNHPYSVPADTKLLLLGNRELKVTIQAPLLRPHPMRGTAVASTGGTVTLEAVRAPRLSFGIAESTPARSPSSNAGFIAYFYAASGSGASVTLVPIDGSGATPTHHPVWPDGDRYVCGPLPTGRFDIWVRSLGRGAPTPVRDVLIGDEDLDLGRIDTVPGSTLTMQLVNLKPGGNVYVGASLAAAQMHLGSASVADGLARLTRLPAATVQLSFRVGKRQWTQDFESDGKSDRTIEVDCGER